jgi:ABC-type multidrug transport system ATPase subunit
VKPFLQFAGIQKRYGGRAALNGINLEIEQGSTLALLGPNGAGKSTLFGCLLGFTRPTAGTVTWRGQSVTNAARRRFGYTPERIALYWQQSVLENGLFFARLRGLDRAELEKQLKRVGLSEARHRKAQQLSKGMLQRLGLAIALCGAPELVVLDEPFNGLDPVLLDELSEILRDEQNRGATLLISTHTIAAVESLATHVAVLLEGRLAAFESLAALRTRYDPGASLEAIYRQIATDGRAEEAEVLA